MSQEAKVIALEHMVVTLMKELETRCGSQPEVLVDRAIHSMKTANYPGEADRSSAAVGALQDLWALLGTKPTR
jgi:hypothetical protein